MLGLKLTAVKLIHVGKAAHAIPCDMLDVSNFQEYFHEFRIAIWWSLNRENRFILHRYPGIANMLSWYDDVIKWKHFPGYWPFVRGLHRSPVNSPYKGQWRVALMFSLICAWISGWANNGEAGDLGRHGTHYDVTVMSVLTSPSHRQSWYWPDKWGGWLFQIPVPSQYSDRVESSNISFIFCYIHSALSL